MEIDLSVIITHMNRDDILAVAKVHSQQFPRQHNSSLWISCNFSAFPRIMLFIARDEKGHVVGYIQWIQKSGFRKESVIELEQIAVLKKHQGNGIGTKLVKESLSFIKDYLNDSNSILKSVLVTTRTDNAAAQALYKKALGAEEIAVIKGLYSHDEVIMLVHGI